MINFLRRINRGDKSHKKDIEDKKDVEQEKDRFIHESIRFWKAL